MGRNQNNNCLRPISLPHDMNIYGIPLLSRSQTNLTQCTTRGCSRNGCVKVLPRKCCTHSGPHNTHHTHSHTFAPRQYISMRVVFHYSASREKAKHTDQVHRHTTHARDALTARAAVEILFTSNIHPDQEKDWRHPSRPPGPATHKTSANMRI